ncbi:DUF1641 domain-containing protein [Alicyclobacillus sp. ALC3]|uniref:DUF1641 domain-containing protein n=1 Tax=Alicyclobacillus sp. ALC3 TaxID=2796143 RepID=UPI0023792307|nr:DUF1641 domain-containing protein [Alicyclobacillus sp. ALC3]WDL98418.1 DUF1641 domain-containing protein [Alicyclobacillus sp. ALC3]
MSIVDVSERQQKLELALDTVAKWETDGSLENLDTLVHLFNAALNSMTPEIVDGLVGTLVGVMELGDQLLQSKLYKMAPELLTATEAILTEPPKSKLGVRQFMRTLKEPEVQTGLNVMLALVREIGKQATNSKPNGGQ